MTDANKNIFYVMLIAAMIAWGVSSVNIKILSNYINAYEAMLFRYLFTAITMIPIILYMRKSFKIDIKSFLLILLSSFIFIAYTKYFFEGTQLGTASLGGALVRTLAPINTFIILALIGTKKITKKNAFALALGGLGVLTMLDVWSFKIEEIFLVHNLYFILASVLWPIVAILSSKATNISSIIFTFYMYIVTSVLNIMLFVDLTTIDYESFDFIFYVNMIVLILLATTFANTIYFLGVEKLGAGEVSSFIFLVPFFAILLSSVFLDEPMTLSIVIGTILTLVAVKVLNDIKIFKKSNKRKWIETFLNPR